MELALCYKSKFFYKIWLKTNIYCRVQECAPNVNLTGASIQLPVPTFGSNPGFVASNEGTIFAQKIY
jgi:hypothetical protein